MYKKIWGRGTSIKKEKKEEFTCRSKDEKLLWLNRVGNTISANSFRFQMTNASLYHETILLYSSELRQSNINITKRALDFLIFFGFTTFFPFFFLVCFFFVWRVLFVSGVLSSAGQSATPPPRSVLPLPASFLLLVFAAVEVRFLLVLFSFLEEFTTTEPDEILSTSAVSSDTGQLVLQSAGGVVFGAECWWAGEAIGVRPGQTVACCFADAEWLSVDVTISSSAKYG